MLARLKKICSDEDVKVDKEVLSRIIIKSEGGMRDAESLLGQILSLNLKKITAADAELMLPVSNVETAVSLLEKMFASEPSVALEMLEQIVKDGTNLDQFALDLLDALHALLLISSGAPESGDFSDTTLKKLRVLASQTDRARLVMLIENLLKRRLDMKTAPVPQLPLELLVVEFGVASISPPFQPARSTRTSEVGGGGAAAAVGGGLSRPTSRIPLAAGPSGALPRESQTTPPVPSLSRSTLISDRRDPAVAGKGGGESRTDERRSRGVISPLLGERQREGYFADDQEGKPETPEEGTFLFEPNPTEVLEVLLPRLVEMQMYQAILESDASEHSARMLAMRNASDAATDMIKELNYSFNKARQAAITQEISEIVGGAAALG